MIAPWSPMQAPPLPCRNDLEWDTCAHAYWTYSECPECVMPNQQVER